jgi:hypothetical protein
MARARWIVPWADSETKPAIYHCIARVVDRRFAFGSDDKEQFRIYMRIKITADRNNHFLTCGSAICPAVIAHGTRAMDCSLGRF